ncbi:uncharacterized protein LOC129230387 [Uloborus diversus]|uniref:uncharacterized protein LOC129230387 n=1 Tax=Uloborus diversus TaxID=327109 RepID=UPI002409748B|nr:uncharacterized protein LOC129230387 [Uloborus diversus]
MEPKLPPPRLISAIASTDNHDSLNKVWEIGVPGKKSLYWSILVAYLTTPNIPTGMELKERLRKIVGDQPERKKERSPEEESKLIRRKEERKFISLKDIDAVSLRRRLKNFNSFKNRHVFYFDKLMKDILMVFKFRLNKYSCTADPNLSKDRQKLEKASQMLSCSIGVLYFQNGAERYESFPKTKLNASELQIFLLAHLDEDVGFRFGMDVTLANPLRKEALAFILDKAKIVLEKDKQNELSERDEIFLISALKQMEPNNICEIYESPYITMKISEAGFETNPLAKDLKGLSAFAHAVSTADAKLCGALYDSAVNSHWLSGCSTRNPNESVVDGLQLFKQQIENDKEITKKKETLKEICETNQSEAKNIVSSANDPISDLELVLSGKRLKKKRFAEMCKELELQNETACLLKDFVSGTNKHKRHDNLLSVIIERIQLLKKILIDDSSEISNMWIKGKNKSTKQHAVYKILRRYIQIPEVRISSEILLQDCMTILGNEEENARELWNKSDNLYCGYNLRLALAHGNPILESIGSFLDCEDLPSNYINKILQLIEDEPLLREIEELCHSIGITDFSKFHEAINKDDDNFLKLQSLVESCKSYYSKILPNIAVNK